MKESVANPKVVVPSLCCGLRSQSTSSSCPASTDELGSSSATLIARRACSTDTAVVMSTISCVGCARRTKSWVQRCLEYRDRRYDTAIARYTCTAVCGGRAAPAAGRCHSLLAIALELSGNRAGVSRVTAARRARCWPRPRG